MDVPTGVPTTAPTAPTDYWTFLQVSGRTLMSRTPWRTNASATAREATGMGAKPETRKMNIWQNHERIEAPRPGSAKKKPPPLPPPFCKVGPEVLPRESQSSKQKFRFSRHRLQTNIAVWGKGWFLSGGFFFARAPGWQEMLCRIRWASLFAKCLGDSCFCSCFSHLTVVDSKLA